SVFEPAGSGIGLCRGFIHVGPVLEDTDDLVTVKCAKRVAGLDPRRSLLRSERFIEIQRTGEQAYNIVLIRSKCIGDVVFKIVVDGGSVIGYRSIDPCILYISRVGKGIDSGAIRSRIDRLE